MNISATDEPKRIAPERYTTDVVSWALNVPIGMERDASFRFPDRLLNNY